MPVRSAISTPVVITAPRSAQRCVGTKLMHLSSDAHVVDGQHGVLAAEADVGECPARSFRRGALEHRLEVGVRQAGPGC